MARLRKVPKARKQAAPVARSDGWENSLSGFGVLGRDKRLGSSFSATQIPPEVAEEIWQGDDIVARIIETIPDEMLREGFRICVSEKDPKRPLAPLAAAAAFKEKGSPGTPPGVKDPEEKAPQKKPPFKADDLEEEGDDDPTEGEADDPAVEESDDGKDLSEDMDAEMRRLNVVESLRTALYYERAYGGGAILLGAEDGATNLELPLNEEKVKTFDWLSVLTPRELVPERYYADPRKPKYGEIAIYRLVPIDAPPGAPASNMPLIHESRVIRFGGISTSRGSLLRNAIPGWGQSVLVRCLQVVNDFQASWQGVGILLTDFAVETLKIKGLAKVLASQGANDQSLATRARAMALGKTIAGTAIVDAEEEYKRETTTVTGLSDLLEKLALRLAASVAMPVSLLMGQAPAGLNATGDSDIRWFYDQISARQEKVLRPAIMRIALLVFLSKAGPAKGKEPDNWDLEFNPLWQLTELEQATLRKTQAETDVMYIDAQVVTDQEIARSRFGGDGYSTDTTIDHELRAEMASADDEMTKLGAGAAEDKVKEQELAAEAAKKPGIPGAGPPGAGGKKPFPPK